MLCIMQENDPHLHSTALCIRTLQTAMHCIKRYESNAFEMVAWQALKNFIYSFKLAYQFFPGFETNS